MVEQSKKLVKKMKLAINLISDCFEEIDATEADKSPKLRELLSDASEQVDELIETINELSKI